MVLIAPAPGVKLITTQAVSSESQVVSVTVASYGVRSRSPPCAPASSLRLVGPLPPRNESEYEQNND